MLIITLSKKRKKEEVVVVGTCQFVFFVFCFVAYKNRPVAMCRFNFTQAAAATTQEDDCSLVCWLA